MADLTHSGLVEKVARALCISDKFDPDAPFEGGQNDANWTAFTDAARAAISAIFAALEKPTAAMIDAGVDALDESDPNVWRIIRAAIHASPLKEE